MVDNRKRDFSHLETTKDMDETESLTKPIPSCSSLIETDETKVASSPDICSDVGDIEESVASRRSTSRSSSISRTSSCSSAIQTGDHSRSQTVETRLTERSSSLPTDKEYSDKDYDESNHFAPPIFKADIAEKEDEYLFGKYIPPLFLDYDARSTDDSTHNEHIQYPLIESSSKKWCIRSDLEQNEVVYKFEKARFLYNNNRMI